MKLFILFFIVLLAAFACTKTISPALNGASTQLIIQGAISDTAGPYYVSIVNSVGFYTPNTYPGVSGAAVTITDSTAGLQDVMTEISSGVYVSHAITQGMPGHTYLLSVVLNGKIYSASSTMPMPVLLDSIDFDTSDTTQIQARANFQDPINIVNFYKYAMVINGTVDKRFQTVEDRLSDGKYIHDKVDADTGEIKRNYLVRLSLVGIDKRVYTYLHESEDIAYSNGSLTGPSNPVSNISGGCLGYFSAQTVSSKEGMVKF